MTDELLAGDTSQHSGVSRRSVVKTGANLAWAVPAVAMVTSAPAMAASGGTVVVDPPSEQQQNVEGQESSSGNKSTAIVPMGTAETPLQPGDLIVSVKTGGKIGGNGGTGWTRNPSAGRRTEYTFVLTRAVASGEEVPDLKVNIKARKKKGRKQLPKRSRYFVTDGNTGDVLWTGVIKS